MNQALLIRNISHLVTCDDSDRVLRDVSMLVKGGVIRAVCEDEALPSLLPKHSISDPSAIRTIDARGCALYPGLVNTHHHFYQIFSRNLPEVQNLELFPWLKALYQIWRNLNAEVVYYSSLCGMGELLKCGCTTSTDHHYVFPSGCGMDLMEAQFAAAEALGMRFHATRGSMDLSEKDGGLPPDSVVQTIDAIMKDSEEAVRRFHDGGPHSMRRVALAPCSPFSVSKALLSESAALARKLGVRLHTHLAETKDITRKACLAREKILCFTSLRHPSSISNSEAPCADSITRWTLRCQLWRRGRLPFQGSRWRQIAAATGHFRMIRHSLPISLIM